MLRFVTISRSENEYGKWQILVWNRVGIWRTGRHTPTKNSHESPPPGPILIWDKNWLFPGAHQIWLAPVISQPCLRQDAFILSTLIHFILHKK